jgi:hypothetical protein
LINEVVSHRLQRKIEKTERKRKSAKSEERDVLTSNDVGGYIRMAKKRRDGLAKV